MLKKSAAAFLASLRGSTYHRVIAAGAAWGGWVKMITPRLGHCRLTASPARTDVAFFLHRAVRLAAVCWTAFLSILEFRREHLSLLIGQA